MIANSKTDQKFSIFDPVITHKHREFYEQIVNYGKINMIDRNLLERTCDVRWWALETAFCECLETFQGVNKQLKKLDERASA